MSYFPDESRLELCLRPLEDALLYAPVDDDLLDDAQGASPSTETGGLILDHPCFTPQVGAGCVLAAEAETNYVNDPQFGNGTLSDEWTNNGMATFERSTTRYKVGTHSLHCVSDDAADYVVGNTVADADASETWTASCLVYIESGDFKLIIEENAGGWSDAASTAETTTGGWILVTVTAMLSGGVTDARVKFQPSATAASEFYIDAVNFTQNGHPTPHTDGTLGTGHSWSGTAHRSSSSRTACNLEYTPTGLSETEGTFAAWVELCSDPDAQSSNRLIFAWWDGASTESIYLMIDSFGYVSFVVYDGSAQQVGLSHDVTDWNPYERHHVLITWKVNDCRLFIDGQQEGQDTSCTMPTITSGVSAFGSTPTGTNQLNGASDEIILLDYAVTADEAETIYKDGNDGIDFEGVWTDIMQDVAMSAAMKGSRGIKGYGPLYRTAGAGTISFKLINSAKNSGGLAGYYSPGHTNARVGFDVGIGIRHIAEVGSDRHFFFKGTLSKATPKPGVKYERVTDCIASDWMHAASLHKVDLLEVQQSIRSDAAIQLIVDNVPTTPAGVSLNTGQETFTYWGDDLKDERTSARAALDRVVMSEFGFVFVRADGTLVYQDRHARVKDTTIQHTFTEAHISGMKVDRDQRNVTNKVEAIAYPREIGTTTETLYSLQTPVQIGANQTRTLRARYTDPDNRDVRLAGTELEDAEGKNELVDQGAASDRGFEVDTGSWSANTMASIERSTAQAKRGSASLLATTGTGGSNNYRAQSALLTGFAQNDVVYYQAHIYFSSAWPVNLAIIVAEYDSSDVLGTVTVLEQVDKSGTGAWHRISGTHTCIDSDCAKTRWYVGSYDAGDFSGGAVTVYIDECYVIHDSNLSFEFSSADTGGGDKNGELLLHESNLGGNLAEFVLENTSASDGYVNELRVRGTAIRMYEPAEMMDEDTDSQALHYKRPLTLRLKYQDQPLVAQNFAEKVLADWKDPQTILERFTFHGYKSQTLFEVGAGVMIGERFAISETITAVDGEYMLNGVEWAAQPTEDGVAYTFVWYPTSASTELYWLLGLSGSGNVGLYTWLGF